jgi:WD40-like Beta Propeller Repeat
MRPAVKRSALAALAAWLLGCGSVVELLGVIGADGGSTGLDAGLPDSTVSRDASSDSEAAADSAAAEAQSDAADAGDGAALDAGFLRTPFGPPAIVAAIADIDADNEDPSMTGDSLELYFSSTRSGNQDIWLSVRSSADAGWGAPTPVTELNSPTGEGAPGVSLDGLTIWFSRSSQVLVSTRTARTQPWGTPSPVAELNTPGSQLDPAVDESSLLLFFASNRGDAGYDLYASSRPDLLSAWSPPAPIPGLNTPVDDLDPFVGSFGLQVWFASSRSGAGDLFWSSRSSVTDPFAPPVALDSLNTAFKESDPTLSADFHYILFASSRAGMPQIYEAYR